MDPADKTSLSALEVAVIEAAASATAILSPTTLVVVTLLAVASAGVLTPAATLPEDVIEPEAARASSVVAETVEVTDIVPETSALRLRW